VIPDTTRLSSSFPPKLDAPCTTARQSSRPIPCTLHTP
jgi:hypothetical protein